MAMAAGHVAGREHTFVVVKDEVEKEEEEDQRADRVVAESTGQRCKHRRQAEQPADKRCQLPSIGAQCRGVKSSPQHFTMQQPAN